MELQNMVDLNFDKMNGLIPAIVQDYKTNNILMLAFMNKEAWLHTVSTKKATFYSRTRKGLWVKGETSGHIQVVKEIFIDCDNDTVLLRVEQIGGAACHTGYASCFYKKIEDGQITIMGEPVFNPKEVYQSNSEQ
jgi:phosphoribosyl-AMP cyclohydrolase